jgi:hypothetical protein
MATGGYSVVRAARAGDRQGRAFVLGWLTLVSAAGALAITVLLFDRTTLGGMTALWLTSFTALTCASLVWWLRPTRVLGQLQFGRYEPVSLLVGTLPLLLGSLAVVVASYQSDEIHNELYSRFYYQQLFTRGYLPVAEAAVIYLYCFCLPWIARTALARIAENARPRAAVASALSSIRLPYLLGLLALGLLLSTVSISMMNVNFWRYWATADGWAVVGHYPFTLSDTLHVQEGGVSLYFVSYPLLPLLLTISFNLLGHNTLAAHLPMVLASAVLPLALFLLIKEVTSNRLLALLVACITATFPLLRGYTLNVAEADGLLLTTLVLAAYFQIRSSRFGSSTWTHLAAGAFAGLATLARPEGVLYMIAMHLVALKERWRQGSFWLSTTVWLVFAAAYSAVLWREFGMLWPGNHAGSISLSNFGETLEVVRGSGILGLYAEAFAIGEGAFLLLVAMLAAGIALATARMLGRDFGLIFMPVAAIGNIVMVFFVGPVAAEAGKYHDFFRHISYGMPFLAVTLAYGASALLEAMRGRWGRWSRFAVYATLAAAVLAQISLLQAPVDPYSSHKGPVMTSDVHVPMSELVARPYQLPVMPFKQAGQGYVPDAPEYMAVFPADVHQFYAPVDVRSAGHALDYYHAVKLLFVGLLALMAMAAALDGQQIRERLDTRVEKRISSLA